MILSLPPVSSAASPEPSPADAPLPPAAGDSGQPSFAVGQLVRLTQRPPYLKSADPMPMLRPPDLVDADEAGVVVELRSHEQRAVRFRRGTFLLTVGQLQRVEAQPEA